MSDNTHDLQLTVLQTVSFRIKALHLESTITLKRLSCNTLLIAASSPLGASFVWNTTPNDPFPTILH